MRKRVLAFILAVTLVFAYSPENTYADTKRNFTTPVAGDVGVDSNSISSSDVTSLNKKLAQAEKDIQNDSSDGNTYITPHNWKSYRSNYVYEQMSANERAFYNALDELCCEYLGSSAVDAVYKKGRGYSGYYMPAVYYRGNGVSLSYSQAERVYELFVYGNPQYYFIKQYFLLGSDSNGYCVYMECYPAFADGDTRANVTNQMFNTVDSWVASVTDDEVTDLQKEKSAHDLICNQLQYVTGKYDQSAYSAIVQKKTVCAGYSEALAMVLNAAGVDTVVALSSMHAWNKVKIDGVYYAVDSTWADQGLYIMYDWFNKSDISIQKYDGNSEHVVTYSMKKYFPKARYNISSAPVGGSTVVTTAAVTTTEVATTEAANELISATTEATTTEAATTEAVNKYTNELGLKATSGKNKVYLYWDRYTSITGYEIQISRDSFKTIAARTSLNRRFSSATISGVKKGAKLSIRIRCYKIVGSRKYVTNWSTIDYIV